MDNVVFCSALQFSSNQPLAAKQQWSSGTCSRTIMSNQYQLTHSIT